MLRSLARAVLFFVLAAAPGRAGAQDFYPGHDIEVLRGEVCMEMEPISGPYIEEQYPLDADTLRRRALEEAAMFYSAMIYGWSFHYDIGEKARGIPEEFELEPLGTIPWGDPGLFATDVEFRDMKLFLWTDYRLGEAQKRRIGAWRAGMTRSIQGIGYGPLGGPPDVRGWIDIKKNALKDAARSAVRAMLRQLERNRPKEVTGLICLTAFPKYWMEGGRWAASGRFRVEVSEIIPFAAY
ncbi:MAG: hypothetical protein LBT87_09310 [Treponema sp.]|jgi:hypothetical protein|nr:hypothetical protein [Treponema sp.]